jgi:hypothetical protein
MDQSEDADHIAQSALNSIQAILHDLPEQVEEARRLPRDVEDTSKVTSQVSMNLKSCALIYKGKHTRLKKYRNLRLLSVHVWKFVISSQKVSAYCDVTPHSLVDVSII